MPGRSPVFAPNGMASTSQPLSTQAALNILQKGGNALDAAISACAVQAVVEPASTGIGGDCFCLYSLNNKNKVIALNGSGRAPKNLTCSWLMEREILEIEQQSPHSVTTPTAIDAWIKLNNDYGSMPLADLLEPAIKYAKDGFAVGERCSFDFSSNFDLLKNDRDIAKVFLKNNKTFQMGEILKQPKLAKTLEEIALNGREGFYSGWVADDILKKLKSMGGHHTNYDFENAISNYVNPIKTNFRGYDVWECPPNGQGIIALLLLNIMSGVETFGDNPLSIERVHAEIEAGKLAYNERSIYLADPEFSEVPVKKLLSSSFAENLRKKIKSSTVLKKPWFSELPEHKSTVYITVVDKDRNACSLINTIFHSFGSGILCPESGVILQNRGMGFVVNPEHPNCIEPLKRPLHTIIPGMMTKDSKTIMSFGVMGGEYQAFGHMQFLTRLIDYNFNIQAAQDLPRFFPDPFSDRIDLENSIPHNIKNELTKLGHNVSYSVKPIGGSQAIWIDPYTNHLIGGSDPRKDGCAIGY